MEEREFSEAREDMVFLEKDYEEVWFASADVEEGKGDEYYSSPSRLYPVTLERSFDFAVGCLQCNLQKSPSPP